MTGTLMLRGAWRALSRTPIASQCPGQHELLCTPVVDDLCRVEVPLRIDGHVVHDVELAGVRALLAHDADLRHRLAIEDHDAHGPGVDDVEELLARVG